MMATEYLDRGDGERIAYRLRSGRAPGIVWLGGFKSAMTGNKAERLDAWAARSGRACLRFDYFGHGESSGDFADGTVSRWRDDALAVIDTLTEGALVLVGSSMGAWITLLAAAARRERIAALLLIAPATDFTEALLWARLPDEIRSEIMEKGVWMRPSIYDAERYPITRRLVEDGRRHLLLDRGPIAPGCPVRILQGMRDPDVPWQHALKLAETLEGDVSITFVKEGDHRLSTPSDLKLLERTLDGLVADVSSS
jgi:pimeloyl-ACP methyl ester carboxylesterase